MGKEIITFGNIEIEKYNFDQYIKLISKYDVNIDKMVVSNKVPFGKKSVKCFNGYENDDEKLCPCVKCFQT